MRQFFYVFCLLILFSNCTNNSNSNKTLSHFIPDNSAIIFKTKSLETLESDIKNNDFIGKLSSAKLLENLTKALKKFDSIKIKNEVVICISDDNHISFITNLSETFQVNDSLQNSIKDLFKTIVDSIAIVSTSKDIIDKVSLKQETDSYFEKLFKSTNSTNATSTFINTKNAKKLTDSVFNHTINLNLISDWLALDVNLQQDQILINGVATVSDTLPKLINVFKNTIPQENKTAIFTPSTSDGFISLTFDDFSKFYQGLIEYNLVKSQDSLNLDLFNSVTEIGLIYNKKKLAIALHSSDIIETKDALLSEQNSSSTYREINIYNFSKNDLFKTVLYPFINNEVDKYIVLDQVVLFSNSEELLTQIITDQQSKLTISDSEVYKNNLSHLSDESSMLFVANNENFKSTLIENSSEKLKNNIKKLDLKSYHFSALQFVQDSDFAHVHAIIQKNKSKASKNSITQQFNIKLDDAILSTPQIVKNHRTNEKEIIVQDVKNNLYLISNRGKVLWKKLINGTILGKVEQIDIYKNGRLQLAFATPNRIYVLDRNGKDVKPFPKKFNDEITQPLSVFDYDKRKNYRFLVTQGKHTLMYDAKGNTVKGFTFKKTKDNIITQPKHFRIGSKDYIVFASGKKLNILNRTGKVRINVKNDFNFSDNEIFLYRSNFSFTTTDGSLKQINQKGSVTTKNLSLPENHDLTTTSKTLVSSSENILNIKSNTVELDFGEYTKPEIFYLRDKIYVAVTDLQAQKAYLFDSQGKSISNFPVFGNSTLQLDNLDKDRNLEFVVKGDSNSIILYQLN